MAGWDRSGRRMYLRIGIAAGLLGLVSSGFMVWQASNAAFSGTTSNPGNSWTAGAVTMTDDDGGASPTTGTAMFNASGLLPSSPATVKCIKVTYTGNVVPQPVRLYAQNHTGTLDAYLNMTVDVGAAAGPGGFAGCGGFVSSSTIYPTATLAAFNTAYHDYGTGLSTGWTPTGNGDYRVFRFTLTVANDNNANGQACTDDFTWEANG